MRVIYVACNPAGAGDLMLPREVTELQRRFLTAAGEPVDFQVYPSLPVEELALELGRRPVDVVHISAHGSDQDLMLANGDGAQVKVTGDMLGSFLTGPRPPKLVFVNACNSAQIAERVAQVTPLAIGTTAPVTNRGARAFAVQFYDRLLGGSTVAEAFRTCRASLEALHGAHASCQLFPGEAAPAANEPLYRVLRVVARFHHENSPVPDKHGLLDVELGLTGCPRNTHQVVFFTDDLSFFDDADHQDPTDEQDLAYCLCRVVRGAPMRQVMWSQEFFGVWGDYRVMATATTAAGECLSVSSTLCEALDAYYAPLLTGTASSSAAHAAAVRAAIERLRSLDGTRGPSWKPPEQEVAGGNLPAATKQVATKSGARQKQS